MVEPKWVQEEMAKVNGRGKPLTENMQRKMNGSAPEPKEKKDATVSN